jgi:hypothetical protein
MLSRRGGDQPFLPRETERLFDLSVFARAINSRVILWCQKSGMATMTASTSRWRQGRHRFCSSYYPKTDLHEFADTGPGGNRRRRDVTRCNITGRPGPPVQRVGCKLLILKALVTIGRYCCQLIPFKRVSLPCATRPCSSLSFDGPSLARQAGKYFCVRMGSHHFITPLFGMQRT